MQHINNYLMVEVNQTDEVHRDAAQQQLPDGRVNHTDEVHSDAAHQQLPDGSEPN